MKTTVAPTNLSSRAALTTGLLMTLIVAGTATPADAHHIDPAAATPTEEALNFGNMTVDARRAIGQRPLAVTLMDFADDRFPESYRAMYDYMFFGVGTPPEPPTGVSYEPSHARHRNLRSYFNEVSHGLFNWRRAGVLGPYTYPNDPRTTANESQKACVMRPQSCPGVGLVNFRTTSSSKAFLLTVPRGGGEATSVVNATADRPEAYEGFTLVDRNGGTLDDRDEIELISYTNHYLSRASGGGLVATSTSSGTNTRFRIDKRGGSSGSQILHDDPVALWISGNYLTAENGGGAAVSTNRTAANAWETFTFFEAPHDGARHRRTAMERAAANGLNFAQFDSTFLGGDGDGTVEATELSFFRILSNASGAAQASSLPRPALLPGSTLRLNPSVVGADREISFSTAAHELTHLLGAFDLYGAGQDLNRNLTLMGATPSGAFNRESFHLDPWHKMRLGWLRPDIRSLDTTQQGCRTVAPARVAGSPDRDSVEDRRKPFLFYRPSRAGTDEMYVLEYRTSHDSGYDGNVASNGMALWLAQTQPSTGGIATKLPGGSITGGNQDGSLATTAIRGDDTPPSNVAGEPPGSVIGRGPNQRLDTTPSPPDIVLEDRGVVAVTPQTSTQSSVPAGTWGDGRLVWGGTQLWRPADGVIRPVWVDGTSTRLQVQVGRSNPLNGMEVQWSANRGYTPRLTGVSATAGSAGSSVRLQGELGVRTGKTVYFVSGTRWYRTTTSTDWGCSFGAATVPNVPSGDYEIVVMAGPTASNRMRFTVN